MSSFKFGSLNHGGAAKSGGLYAGIALDGKGTAKEPDAAAAATQPAPDADAESKPEPEKGWSASLRFAPVVRRPPAKKNKPLAAAFSAPSAAPKPAAAFGADDDDDEVNDSRLATLPLKGMRIPGKARAALTSTAPLPGSAPFAPPPSNIFASDGGFLAAHAPERHPAFQTPANANASASDALEAPTGTGKGWAPVGGKADGGRVAAAASPAPKRDVDPSIPGLQTSLPALLSQTSTLSGLVPAAANTEASRPQRRKLAQPPPLTLPPEEEERRKTKLAQIVADVNGFSLTDEGKKMAARNNKKKKGKGKQKEVDPAIFYAEDYDPLRPTDYTDWMAFYNGREAQRRFQERAERESSRKDDRGSGDDRYASDSDSYSSRSRSRSRARSRTRSRSRSRARSYTRSHRSRSRSRSLSRRHSRSRSVKKPGRHRRHRSRSRSISNSRSRSPSPPRKTKFFAPPPSYDDSNKRTAQSQDNVDNEPAPSRPSAMGASLRQETADEAYARRLAMSRAEQLHQPCSAAEDHDSTAQHEADEGASRAGQYPQFVSSKTSRIDDHAAESIPASTLDNANGEDAEPSVPVSDENDLENQRQAVLDAQARARSIAERLGKIKMANASPVVDGSNASDIAQLGSVKDAQAPASPRSAVSELDGDAMAMSEDEIPDDPIHAVVPALSTEEAKAKARLIAARLGAAVQAQEQAAAESAARKAPGQANFARRFMEKSGWKEGQGLGANESGRTSFLTVESTTTQQQGKRKNTNSGEGDDEDNGRDSKRMVGVKGRGIVVDQERIEREREERQKYGEASKIVCLSNIVGPGDVDDELAPEIAEEASKHGIVERCFVRILQRPCEEWEAVRVFIVFTGLAGAWKALKVFDGRFFGGRQVQAKFYKELTFARGDLDV